MSAYKTLLSYLPDVSSPTQKGTLKNRLLWTFGILVLFLFLASIPLYGVNESQNEYFEQIELLLGAKFGKLLTLGIGPIVTASIVLQLLKGTGLLNFDLQSEEGKFLYSGTLKLLTFAFIIIESIVYVKFGAVSPSNPALSGILLVALQLALGGFIVVYMDEIIKKWGFGSGVSIFIAAGIGQAVFLQLISPFATTGSLAFVGGSASESGIGALWQGLAYASLGQIGDLAQLVLFPILTTIIIYFVVVFFQSVNVEIPLSFGRVRGQSFRWPLNFFYAGVIPVILISALSANFGLWSYLWEEFRGLEQGSSLVSRVVTYLQPPVDGIVGNLSNFLSFDFLIHALTYSVFVILGSVMFSYFWVQTAGMDSRSQAKQIINSGLQIPGFRKDERIVERILDRYIIPLTIMGGVGIGVLAASADILGALTSGTGILLMIMIIYQFYQQLARESMDDFSLLRRFMKR